MLEQGRLAEAAGLVALKVPSATKHVPIAVLVLPFHDTKPLVGEIAVADYLTDGCLQLGLGC
ncbi:MAG: LLM class flavin-dependent oxidoreductase, partial [Gammaproteobacteria bacterium]|nr:LLM class flavin-dependent oxidoreductase [Gammaproteobacteria bacterium]